MAVPDAKNVREDDVAGQGFYVAPLSRADIEAVVVHQIPAP
jgi:hypothetical protein